MAEPNKNRETPSTAENLLPEMATPSSLGAMPRRARLDVAAENIGSAMGSAAATLRAAQSRLQVVPRRIREVRNQMAARSGEATENIAATAEKWRWQAQAKAQRTKGQTIEYCQENPMQVILAAAGAAFITGAALRIWRSRD